MKLATLVLMSTLPLTTPLLAQDLPLPIITSIAPSSGPASGGTAVTIHGEHFSAPNFACFIDPCVPLVTFGGAPFTGVKSYSDTDLVVVTPSHVSGAVDVTVQTPDGRAVTAQDAYTFTGASTSEIVLLPVYIATKTNGAGGSTWQTDFWIRNGGETPLTVAPVSCPPNMACPAVFPPTRVLQPGESMHNLIPDPQPSPNVGRLLYLSGVPTSDVSMNLRVADTSRNALDDGTEVPVVRERDLSTRKLQLLNVPLGGSSRLLLRVYDAALSRAEFRVRYSFMTASGTSEQTLVARTTDSGPFHASPAYAEVSITVLPAGIAARTETTPPVPPLRIEIEPLTPGSRYWAFVSITNNTTQHATIVTPH